MPVYQRTMHGASGYAFTLSCLQSSGTRLVVPFSNLRNELLIGSCPSEQFSVVSPVSAHAAESVYTHSTLVRPSAPEHPVLLDQKTVLVHKWSFIHRICQMGHLSFSFLVRCPCRKLWALSLCPQQRSSSLSPARCVLSFCFSTVSTCFQTGSPWSDLPVCGLYRVSSICYCRVQQSVRDDGISMMCKSKMLAVRTGTHWNKPQSLHYVGPFLWVMSSCSGRAIEERETLVTKCKYQIGKFARRSRRCMPSCSPSWAECPAQLRSYAL